MRANRRDWFAYRPASKRMKRFLMVKTSLMRLVVVVVGVVLAACQTAGDSRMRQQASLEEHLAAKAAMAEERHHVVPEVFFYLGTTQAITGLERINLAQGSIWLVPQPVLARSDLQALDPVRGQDGRVYLRFIFTEPGAVKLAEITRNNTGALLALTVNQELQTVSVIGEPMEQGVLQIPFDNDAQAMQLINAIMDRN